MQHHYLPKASEVREARFHKFLEELATYETDVQKQAAQDRFLDAYSVWLRHRSPVTTENLHQAVLVLRAIDPAFRFPLPLTGGADADA